MNLRLNKQELASLYDLAGALKCPAINKFFNMLFTEDRKNEPFSVTYEGSDTLIFIDDELASETLKILSRNCNNIAVLLDQPSNILIKVPKMLSNLKGDGSNISLQVKVIYNRVKEKYKIAD
jgi:hypothetical protein